MQIPAVFAQPRFFLLFAVVVVSLIAIMPTALGQGSSEDYARSASYNQRTSGRVFRDRVNPVWIGEGKTRFWYRVQTGRRSHEFVVVDALEKHRRLAFDHQALARELSQACERSVSPEKLELRSLAFDDEFSSCKFRFADRAWSFQCPAGELLKLDSENAGHKGDEPQSLIPLREVEPSRSGGQPAPIRIRNNLGDTLDVFWVDPGGRRKKYGEIKPGKEFFSTSYVGHTWVLRDRGGVDRAAFVVDAWSPLAFVSEDTLKPTSKRRSRSRRNSGNRSPDGKWTVSYENDNVVLVSNDGPNRTLTKDGSDRDKYRGRVWWSSDSKHFVVMRTRDVVERQINMVDSAPDGSIHGKLSTMTYVKPGDEIDQPRPVLFHVDQDEGVIIDNKLFDNPFNLTDVAWHANSKSFSFVYNQRGHQVLRVVSVDADTGEPRVMTEDVSDTFVCYSQKKYLRRLDDTDEAIWMSERSGWNHLYLIDQSTGKVKNAITSGDWVVRDVERVDESNRQIWLSVAGVDADQDPYHVHLIRVDFDGKNLTRLTKADGNHQWRFSPDRRYLIDSYSRVDLPPITQLIDCESGDVICILETADASDLVETGWRMPERFKAKGRDGATDIFGVIVRPTNFDPKKRYPVLEDIYAGPHSAFVPKSFGRHNRMAEMAELGFIVVKIDGMGTNHRSKAFHDVCWKNLGDSGFPDRIAWMKAAAAERPEMDLSRVGIWGGSAGGQSAMRALIAHGDFYKAAVADCGCHDNRVDKIWWNEQWMGWPIGPHYKEQSNVTQAHRVKGDLMLIWGELDRNVDPASTTQVIDALVKADVDFEQLIMPGVGHGAAGHPYAKRRQADFFVRKLWKREPRHR